MRIQKMTMWIYMTTGKGKQYNMKMQKMTMLIHEYRKRWAHTKTKIWYENTQNDNVNLWIHEKVSTIWIWYQNTENDNTNICIQEKVNNMIWKYINEYRKRSAHTKKYDMIIQKTTP